MIMRPGEHEEDLGEATVHIFLQLMTLRAMMNPYHPDRVFLASVILSH